MKTYPLYLTEPQLRLVLDLLNGIVDDIAEQVTSQLNGIQADHIPRGAPEALHFKHGATVQRVIKARRKAAPVRRVEAIERLGRAHPEAAKALAAWKNKADGVLGWDRWLRANHPAAAAELWPSEALVDRIKPARHG